MSQMLLWQPTATICYNMFAELFAERWVNMIMIWAVSINCLSLDAQLALDKSLLLTE